MILVGLIMTCFREHSHLMSDVLGVFSTYLPTEFCEFSTVDNDQIYGGDFAKFCGLFTIDELYILYSLQKKY